MPARVSRKDKGSFVVREKMLFIVAERGEVPMSLQFRPSTDGRVPLEDHVGSILARFPWKSFSKYPPRMEGKSHCPGARSSPHHLGARLWGCSWIYKTGLQREVSGATNPAKPPELLLNTCCHVPYLLTDSSIFRETEKSSHTWPRCDSSLLTVK